MVLKIFGRIISRAKYEYKKIIKRVIKKIFSVFGYSILFNSTNELIISRNLLVTTDKITIGDTFFRIKHLKNKDFQRFILGNLDYLKEGLQVLWILFVFQKKRNGYFVEFGACDGLHYSNTNLLEKEFGWSGILAEPNKSYLDQIYENRTAVIDNRAIWSQTGEIIEFSEVSAGGLSGISQNFRTRKGLDKRVQLGIKRYSVKTVSLNDLLDDNNVPLDFDLLSIDTEGSEFEILKYFDLSRYRPKVICVEFAGDSNTEKQFQDLLSRFGYKSMAKEFDDRDNLWFTSS